MALIALGFNLLMVVAAIVFIMLTVPKGRGPEGSLRRSRESPVASCFDKGEWQ